MEQQQIIDDTAAYVKASLVQAEGGHDWWHIYRVWKNAIVIARSESADLFVVQLAALLHDIADSKFHDGDEEVGPATARRFLESLDVEQSVISHVVNIVAHVSFKGGHSAASFRSVELDIVQDADRLDAIGAIGIARAFSYGGFRNRKIYDPAVPPNPHQSKEAYKKGGGPTINHFYEKLLLLKDRMNTSLGRQMAEERHRVMEEYLGHFFRETNI